GGPTGEIYVKGDLVDIDKDILDANDGEDSGKASGKEAEDSWTTYTGDTVDFAIRTTVPNYPAHSYVTEPTFKIYDTWSSGLDTPASVTVTANDEDLDLGDDYTITFTLDGVALGPASEEIPDGFVINLKNVRD